ncbi:MAG: TetR/AcrR family transcriptional regulator [Veillonellaceae bacterium]|uniref:TetR/AcrR family transcriptional regulator n=1 Tax=uncultured Selenomonas sp. TaxID=159275 RepID=UPI0025F8B518|nr:helix-turn-helix domain-containing protein [uncultured Selenomonas sp.]MCI7540804.1 TetR/AcrR family transcriptional regulator [Veillonellaceae bacterium]MDD6128872.1 helix-turn-helix domain containing protein [Veillonellaceae bacterium]MDD6697745.1 helix-turn-helix domain containing protein [Veillonellaceae bacterium]MDY6350147.1 helix-turn-helix domain-containing protein [Selenomonas sp.]
MRKKTDFSSQHIEDVRRRVLNSTKTLLVKHGYKRTTIRMIVEESGVLIGSIYYIFKNKEDIFQSLVLEMVQNGIAKIEARCPGASPIFLYAAVCEVELEEMEASPIIRDVYKEGYESKQVFEHMVNQFVLLAHHVFDDTTYAASDEAYYQRSLLLKGAMHACISELYFETKRDHQKSRAQLLRLLMTLYHVPQAEAERTIREIAEKEAVWLEIANELATRPIGE